MAAKFGRSSGFEGGEFGRETEGWGSGLGGGVNDALDWKNGPSKAFAGDGDRDPGMGSNPDTFIDFD